MAVITNFDELNMLHQEARRKGVGSKAWIAFATTMMDSFPSLHETAKRMNEKAKALRGFHKGDDAEEHF